MTLPREYVLEVFNWEPQPAARALIDELVLDVRRRCPAAQGLAERMTAQTGTRLVDWVDYVEAPASWSGGGLGARLRETGFSHRPQVGAPGAFVHEGAMFPWVVLSGEPGPVRLGVKVDSVADFLACWGLERAIEGEPFSQFRRARAFEGDGAELWVVERHGYRGFAPQHPDRDNESKAMKHLEGLRCRRRDFGIDDAADNAGFEHAHRMIDRAIADLGTDWTCDLFFQAEREYWMRKNRAARVQYARQEALGLGWANHDHHTYRSSRHCFARLVGALEKLGFRCRERFYAGHEAYWGAQVLEPPVAGITIFADVDMTPEELLGDFPHQGFAVGVPNNRLGTIGLWCELHGEAFLGAGMHHLECQFDWHALREQLEREAGIGTMDPFTTFPYLRQAFTEGERWSVNPGRIDMLLKAGQITGEQAAQFRAQGAIGSHLENLERNDGYKGFNQQGVSEIIAKTDPRRQQPALAGD